MSYVICRTYDVVYDIVCSYVRHRTYNVRYRQKNVRCRTFLPVSCQSYVRCCIRCRIRHCMFFGRHRTYNVRYRQKTYYIVRFLQVIASRTCYIAYDIVCFLTMSCTICNATSVLYDIVRKVPMSLVHIT